MGGLALLRSGCAGGKPLQRFPYPREDQPKEKGAARKELPGHEACKRPKRKKKTEKLRPWPHAGKFKKRKNAGEVIARAMPGLIRNAGAKKEKRGEEGTVAADGWAQGPQEHFKGGLLRKESTT